MASDFNPPSIERLPEVDKADCEYQESVIEIEGVVSPASQGGWPHPDGYKVHCICFSAWRIPGHALNHTELTILRPVDPDTDYYSEYPKLSIHRIQVLLSTDETRAIFASVSPHKADPSQLKEVVTELKNPVILETKRFGELTLNRSINWFEGESVWNEQVVRITFDESSLEEMPKYLTTAEKLWDDQALWKQKVDDFAVEQLLSLKNDVWLNEDESPLTAEEFKSRMTLELISIDPNGEFTFWHDDGDLFWGHSIEISGSLKDGLQRADIPG